MGRVVGRRPLAIGLFTLVVCGGLLTGPCKLTRPYGNEVGFVFVVPPGFEGELLAVADPDVPLRFGRTYEVVARDGVVRVPWGFVTSSETEAMAHPWYVVEVRDTEGRVLTRDAFPPEGVICPRSLYTRNGAWYFVVARTENWRSDRPL